MTVANHLLETIASAPVAVDETDLQVQASIGGTFRMPSDRSVAALVERADRALYAAKGSGRNRVVLLPRFSEAITFGATPEAIG
jgi:diguanylate cyclase (GGDEF)-like protein